MAVPTWVRSAPSDGSPRWRDSSVTTPATSLSRTLSAIAVTADASTAAGSACRLTVPGGEADRPCTTCASSCASSRWPACVSGANRPAAKAMSAPTVRACASRERAACAASLPVCTRTRAKSVRYSGSIRARTPRSNGWPGPRASGPASAVGDRRPDADRCTPDASVHSAQGVGSSAQPEQPLVASAPVAWPVTASATRSATRSASRSCGSPGALTASFGHSVAHGIVVAGARCGSIVGASSSRVGVREARLLTGPCSQRPACVGTTMPRSWPAPVTASFAPPSRAERVLRQRLVCGWVGPRGPEMRKRPR